MNMIITDDALRWFKKELNLQPDDYVRFFARYGGCGTVQKGFSLGMSKEKPNEIGAQTILDRITFYIETEDLWYFDQHDLTVTYDNELDEIQFEYQLQEKNC
jgi:uncharacterized protein YneR